MTKKSEKHTIFVSIASTLTLMFIFLGLIILGVSYTSFSVFPSDVVDNSIIQNSDLINFCNVACRVEGGKYLSSVNSQDVKECKCKTFKIAGEIYNKTPDAISETKIDIESTTDSSLNVKTQDLCNAIVNQNESFNSSYSIKWENSYFFVVKCEKDINYNYINANPNNFGYDKDFFVEEDSTSIARDRFKRLSMPLLIIFISIIFALVILNRLDFTLEDFRELVIEKNEENPLTILIGILFVIALVIIIFRIYL